VEKCWERKQSFLAQHDIHADCRKTPDELMNADYTGNQLYNIRRKTYDCFLSARQLLGIIVTQ